MIFSSTVASLCFGGAVQASGGIHSCRPARRDLPGGSLRPTAKRLIEMVHRSTQMLGSLTFRRVMLDARAQALAEIGARTIAQLCLDARNVGEAVPDVSNPRRRMTGF